MYPHCCIQNQIDSDKNLPNLPSKFRLSKIRNQIECGRESKMYSHSDLFFPVSRLSFDVVHVVLHNKKLEVFVEYLWFSCRNSRFCFT